MPSASFRHELGLGDEDEDDQNTYSDEEDDEGGSEDYFPTTPRAKQSFSQGRMPLSPPDSTRRSAHGAFHGQADVRTRTYDAATSGQLYTMSKITDVYASSAKPGNSYLEMYSPSDAKSSIASSCSDYFGFPQSMSRQVSSDEAFLAHGAVPYLPGHLQGSQHWEQASRQLHLATGQTSAQAYNQGITGHAGDPYYASGLDPPTGASAHAFMHTPQSLAGEMSSGQHELNGRFSPHAEFGGPLDLQQCPPVPPIGPIPSHSAYFNRAIQSGEADALQCYGLAPQAVESEMRFVGERQAYEDAAEEMKPPKRRIKYWNMRRGHYSD
jgi:hypothetical protein